MSLQTFRKSLRAHIVNATPMDEEDETPPAWSYYAAIILGSILIALIVYMVAMR